MTDGLIKASKEPYMNVFIRMAHFKNNMLEVILNFCNKK